ncbi:MAG: iron-sulfur cluster assembly protein, partial [Ignavibacteria bacterium]|nr:iron-sulfur cluster assembly protein [Ignavibacteria bacterium]
MALSQKNVIDILKGVIFFAKGDNIVDLGMVDELEVTENEINFRLVFPKLDDPAIKIVSNAATKALH